jgi:hypothetical protein
MEIPTWQGRITYAFQLFEGTYETQQSGGKKMQLR